MNSPKIIESQEAADFLTISGKRFWLYPFFSQDVSQKDVAEYFGITISAVDYRVKKLLAMDLIEVTREKIVDGHRTRYYRVTSQEFIVPLETTSSIDLESHGVEIGKKVAHVVGRGWAYGMKQQSEDWGFRIACGEKIGVYQAIVGKNELGEYTSPSNLPNDGKYLVCDAGLVLSDSDAEKLHDELNDLYKKYRGKSHESDKSSLYFINLGFVPMIPNT